MPHLSKLQQRYAKEVQIIGVSSEDPDLINEFLKSPSGNPDQTFGQVVQHYCLVSDPDGSTQRDYMDAARMNSIPTAFVIGKDSRIRWVGHPMELDAAIEAAVTGT
jgi:hypothetical protein